MMRINDLFKESNLPKKRLIVFHARIKTLRECSDFKDIPYEVLTQKLIDTIIEKYDPISILIPAYTYSFTRSGIFHRLFSKVESGRFSEEARMMNYYRTPNPIFSFIDTSGYFVNADVNHNVAFGNGSIFEHFHEKDAVILNVGLDRFIASQRHYAEYYFDVEYRFNKIFKGIVYSDETEFEKVNYEFYVRDLNKSTDGNLVKITNELIEENVLNSFKYKNILINWLTCKPYLEFFKPKMKKNINYMIT